MSRIMSMSLPAPIEPGPDAAKVANAAGATDSAGAASSLANSRVAVELSARAAAQSAAAVHVFVDAFKRARSLDPQMVRDAIAATELDTFYGPVKFDETGRNVAKTMVLTQVQGGKYVVVAPAKWATGKPVVPRPRR